MESTQDLTASETSSTKFKQRGVCSKQRVFVVGIFLGIVVLCVIVGVAVGISHRQDFDISKASYKQRVKRSEEILDKYPLIDG
ncbi:hypothetical protein BaRGS_00037037 [Batillaria attramentaria]|uniref:Uncharacterized protein n=1 Tax=Batillaria attramentaria TaxID=370345 RepID=A0ABD0JA35_9CAEN